MTLPRSILGLTAVVFIGFGVACSLWPDLMAQLVEIRLPTATARVDFIATYGGFEVGFGVFLLACRRRPAWVEAGLWAGAAALSGFAVARLLSLLVGGASVHTPIYVGLALEVSGILLNLWGLRLMRGSHPSAA